MSDPESDGPIIDFFDAHGATYGRADSGRGLLHRRICRTALQALRGIPAPVLEIGCGNGLFLSELVKSGHQGLLGADFSLRMLVNIPGEVSRQVRPVVTRAQALPFATGSLSAVVCVNVMYNLQSRELAGLVIREAARALRPGGSLVFDFRSTWQPLNRLRFLMDRTTDHPLWTHSMREIRDWIEAAGLFVASCSPILLPWISLAPATVVVAKQPPGGPTGKELMCPPSQRTSGPG